MADSCDFGYDHLRIDADSRRQDERIKELEAAYEAERKALHEAVAIGKNMAAEGQRLEAELKKRKDGPCCDYCGKGSHGSGCWVDWEGDCVPCILARAKRAEAELAEAKKENWEQFERLHGEGAKWMHEAGRLTAENAALREIVRAADEMRRIIVVLLGEQGYHTSVSFYDTLRKKVEP